MRKGEKGKKKKKRVPEGSVHGSGKKRSSSPRNHSKSRTEKAPLWDAGGREKRKARILRKKEVP